MNIKLRDRDRDIKTYLLIKSVFTWLSLIVRFGMSESTWKRITKGLQIVSSLNKHRRYKTLRSVLRKHMDENGIWRHEGIVFSIHGNIFATLEYLISHSETGWKSHELQKYLRKPVKNELKKLYERKKIERVKFGHDYLYVSKEFDVARSQIIKRHRKEPYSNIYIRDSFMTELFGQVSTDLKRITKEILIRRGVTENVARKTEILISVFLRPLLKSGLTDTEHAKFLRKKKELEGFYDFVRCTPGHSEISEVKRELTLDGFREIMSALVVYILQEMGINEISVVVDGTYVYRSQHSKKSVKIHSGAIADIGIPIALEIMEDGWEYDLKSLKSLLEQIAKVGIKVNYVIGDGLYDAPEFYYQVNLILGAEGIARYNPRRSSFSKYPEDNGVLRDLELLNNAREEAIASNREKRRGRKRMVPSNKLELSDPCVQGTWLRNHPVTRWESDERKECYKKRTIIERLFSILKSWLALDGVKLQKSARNMNIYTCFIALLIVAMMSVKVGLFDCLLKVKMFDF